MANITHPSIEVEQRAQQAIAIDVERERTSQLRHQLSAERHRTQGESHKAQVAGIQAAGERAKIQGAQHDLAAIKHQVSEKQSKAQIAASRANMAGDELKAANVERSIRQQLLGESLRGLAIQAATARAGNDSAVEGLRTALGRVPSLPNHRI